MVMFMGQKRLSFFISIEVVYSCHIQRDNVTSDTYVDIF